MNYYWKLHKKCFRLVEDAIGVCTWLAVLRELIARANGACKLRVQMACANGACNWLADLVSKIARADGACKWHMQMAHANGVSEGVEPEITRSQLPANERLSSLVSAALLHLG